LDGIENEELRDPKMCFKYIKDAMKDDGKYYLLLDEVQFMPRFVEVLNSLLRMSNIDVYVTGSNFRFLSSDVVTEFRGYNVDVGIVQICNIPDSFKKIVIVNGTKKKVIFLQCTSSTNLGTVFSGMAEITVLLLAAVLFIVLLILLAVLIISCILIKKRKLKADAWMKIIVFSIFTCVAAFLIQSSVIAVMMAVPVAFGAYVLAK